MFAFHGVSKVYEGKDGAADVSALEDISLEVEHGEFVAVIGPSGCGKTTLLELLAGLMAPSEGTIEIDGAPIQGPHPDIGVVFQEDATFPWMTNGRNVEFGLEFKGVPKAERHRRARDSLALVGLAGFEDRRPTELSGGMRQRVNLARVLAALPKLVLLDEPFGSLDEQTRLVLGDELLRIWGETGTTFLLVTHSLNEAALLADRVVAMSARPGRIAEVVENRLPRPRTSAVIGTPEFSAVTGHLWQLIQGQVRAA
jgi:NitT/TauT family transport system ATP-binding protein